MVLLSRRTNVRGHITLVKSIIEVLFVVNLKPIFWASFSAILILSCSYFSTIFRSELRYLEIVYVEGYLNPVNVW